MKTARNRYLELKHPTVDAWAYSCGGDHNTGNHYKIRSPIGGAVPTVIARAFETACRNALKSLERAKLASGDAGQEEFGVRNARLILKRVCDARWCGLL